MRLPRLEPSAHRFFNREIKQCVWALAVEIGDNQLSDVSAHTTVMKFENERLSKVLVVHLWITNDFKLKSLIMAQIERWRQA